MLKVSARERKRAFDLSSPHSTEVHLDLGDPCESLISGPFFPPEWYRVTASAVVVRCSARYFSSFASLIRPSSKN